MNNTHQLRGIGLMCLAMLSIPLVDGLAKHLSDSYSPLFISWIRYCIASLLILPIGLNLFGRQTIPSENIRSHVLRTVFLVAAMTLFFLAIAITPLATATGAYFIGPIIASILAVYLLGERMTKRRLIALVAGFLGALIVVRPSASVDPGVFLALGSGALFACYLVSTRSASQKTSPVKTLVFQCLLGALELLSAAAIGYVFFGEIPAFHVWIGVSFIVVSGLILIADSSRA